MAPSSTTIGAVSPRVHLPALDGLRGAAVLAVMFFHFHLAVEDQYIFSGFPAALARAGWCGVDLFFVLSGFLITGILLEAKDSPRYFRNFYARRALRIFPLYYAMLAAVFLLAPLLRFLVTPKFETLADHQAPLWLYYSNLAVAWNGRFFFQAEWVELNHFWSLAIEEQFYLIWPAVVLLCGRRALLAVCLTLPAAAFTLRAALGWNGDHQCLVYVLTLCRWDGLAIGGLLALASRTSGWRERLMRPASIVAVASFLGLISMAARENGLPWYKPAVQVFGYSLLAVFFGAVLFLAVHSRPNGRLIRLWTHPALRFFGKYSYGLYVAHPNIVKLLERILSAEKLARWSGAPALGALLFMALALALSIAAALISWHLYEKHFLKLKILFESGQALSAGTSARTRAA